MITDTQRLDELQRRVWVGGPALDEILRGGPFSDDVADLRAALDACLFPNDPPDPPPAPRPVVGDLLTDEVRRQVLNVIRSVPALLETPLREHYPMNQVPPALVGLFNFLKDDTARYVRDVERVLDEALPAPFDPLAFLGGLGSLPGAHKPNKPDGWLDVVTAPPAFADSKMDVTVVPLGDTVQSDSLAEPEE